MKSAITQVTYLLNDPMVSLYSYHFISRKSYFFWEILFKTNCLQHFNVLMLLMKVSKCWKIKEFSKISIKIKNSKTVYEAQRASCFKESTQPRPDRKLLTSLKQKFFWRRSWLCRHLPSKFFENSVLGCLEMAQRR